MKEKTSVTLSKDVLVSIDRLAGSKHSRSAVIERVLRRFLREQGRAQAQARDLDRLNHAAEQLNAEAADGVPVTGRLIRGGGCSVASFTVSVNQAAIHCGSQATP